MLKLCTRTDLKNARTFFSPSDERTHEQVKSRQQEKKKKVKIARERES